MTTKKLEKVRKAVGEKNAKVMNYNNLLKQKKALLLQLKIDKKKFEGYK